MMHIRVRIRDVLSADGHFRIRVLEFIFLKYGTWNMDKLVVDCRIAGFFLPKLPIAEQNQEIFRQKSAI
jgi:hypothetical protein